MQLLNINPALLALVLLLTTLVTHNVTAHNKVVVIPLQGDPLPPLPMAALRPITAADVNANNYIVNDQPGDADDTVIDKTTGLEWQRQYDGVPRNFDDAWTYCRDGTWNGATDWRLPEIGELLSIVDYGNNNPAIEGISFANTSNSRYWSASSVANTSTSAATVHFAGGMTSARSKNLNYPVRCVR